MVEPKDPPSSPLPTGTPGSQLRAEQPSTKRTRACQKRSTTEDIKQEPQRDGQEEQTCEMIKAHDPQRVGDPHTGERLHHGGSPTGDSSEPHVGLCSLRVLYQENGPPGRVALKAGDGGNRDSTVTGSTQNPTCTGTKGRAVT